MTRSEWCHVRPYCNCHCRYCIIIQQDLAWIHTHTGQGVGFSSYPRSHDMVFASLDICSPEPWASLADGQSSFVLSPVWNRWSIFQASRCWLKRRCGELWISMDTYTILTLTDHDNSKYTMKMVWDHQISNYLRTFPAIHFQVILWRQSTSGHVG